MYIDRQNAGPMLTTRQYRKIQKLERKTNNWILVRRLPQHGGEEQCGQSVSL